MTISYVTSHFTELQINWEQMHPADFSFSTLCQDVILFQHSVGLERKRLGYLVQYVSSRSYFRSVITCTKANIHRRFKAVGKSCCSPVPAHNPLSRVNDARKLMFTQNRRIHNILPTLLALDQNVKRAAY